MMFQEEASFFDSIGAKRSYLGVFGKHSQWADHMPDIGMVTPSMIEFKRWLYLDGIRTAVDSRTWSESSSEGGVSKWGHRILIWGAKGIILAELFDTKDMRGRGAYPFVICLHIPTGVLPMSFTPLWEVFDRFGEVCLFAKSQLELESLVRQVDSAILQVMGQVKPISMDSISELEKRNFISNPIFGHNSHKFKRILYNLVNQFREDQGHQGKQTRSFRLPIGETMQEIDLFCYLLLYRSQDPDAFIVSVSPNTGGYFDLFLGDLEASSVKDVKLSTKQISVITDIAYSIPSEELERLALYEEEFIKLPPEELPAIYAKKEDRALGSRILGGLMGRFGRG